MPVVPVGWKRATTTARTNQSGEWNAAHNNLECQLDHNWLPFAHRSYSFIRGQNAPIDKNTLAERANRRLKALEFQNAIKEQLKERENFRRMEEEKRKLEERIQEERILKQMAIEQERVEDEQRKQREKIDVERKKAAMMMDAIEKATQAALTEKARKKRETVAHTPENYSASFEVDSARSADNKSTADLESGVGESDDTKMEKQNVVDSTPPPTPAIQVSPSAPKPVADDGEKILIGSPIRMRKKAVVKQPLSKEPPDTPESEAKTKPEPLNVSNDKNKDLDAIPLVLQGIPPIVPLLNNDLATLNQNIGAINNIQLAVMLAHQMHYFNPLAMNAMVQPSIADIVTRSPPTTAQSSVMSIGAQSISHNLASACNLHSDKHAAANSVVKEICKICDKENHEPRPPSTQSTKSVASATPVRSFRENYTNTLSNVVSGVSGEWDELPLSTASHPQTNDTVPPAMVTSTMDAQTQTDGKTEQVNCCCQQHHHIHYVEIPTTRTPFYAKGGCESIQAIALVDILATPTNHLLSDAMTSTLPRTKTAPESLRIESREALKMQDRPKWGVNRPLNQYVKASERDPMYQRNKRKKSKKRTTADDYTNDIIAEMTRSISPEANSISTCITSNNETPLKVKPNNRISRNICTEILPIKTDVNGRVYLNFEEMSIQMSEDEVRKTLRSQHDNIERIMKRRRTTDDLLRDSISTNGIEEISRPQLPSRGTNGSTRRHHIEVDLE